MPECGDQAETIAFLSKAGSLGASGPVERVDTHAAIVFLTENRAFKLKRAVRFPYLDFSTVEKRRAVCEAELALNRRTAPDLYLSVQSVGRGTDGALALGSGEPVDWVIVMRRFSPECLFSAMAKEGALELSMMRHLADEIAAFHTQLPAQDGHGDVGGACRVRSVIDGNRDSMAALNPGLLDAEDCDRLHRRSLDLLARLTPLLDRRANHGCVRHCHGDLHLANICLWQGRPTLFDCLEFDPELATTDVLYDIAFLVMDLWQRGLHAEASLVFNRYCDMRGESDGLAVMPLFLSMRAAVRAHVEASAAARQEGAGARDEKRTAARRYHAAALDFLDRPQPRLIAVGGLSGTGKSTLAGRLAPFIGAAPGARWLRSDVLRKRMAGVIPEQALPAEAYTRQSSTEVYRRLADEAGKALSAGMDVVVDAVFADPAERQAIAEIAARNGISFDGIWLDAAPAILRGRVTARRGDASDADATVVERQFAYDLGDLTDWRCIDAGVSPDEVFGDALRQISQ